ncbi:hypothetical protein LSH36_194g05092 [Paralvinella palmiformis]|uniref:Chitin-binding type-2 domain-containing protein n=1 Tax=Paralvinella palmiformis TaxID=53620 RepID=A0AAD9JQ19_9ANNE|nr:hypothetical protein LSH36_194g05092 [Paralvinella palmiformis]
MEVFRHALCSRYVWDPEAYTCNHAPSQAPSPSSTTTESSETGYDCDANNPCTPENIDEGNFYFPHHDPEKFVQCDEHGGCFVMPCAPENIEQGNFYFPHHDPHKFVQCDEHGGCFVMPCAPGTVWDPDAYTCNHAPSQAPSPSSTTTESSETGYDCDANNPCTPENIDEGNFYFPHHDPEKFVQCDEHGGCFVMPCAPGTVWDPEAYTCNHAPAPPSNGYDCDANNPCTSENIEQGNFYFPHHDPEKFVQCDDHGGCFVMPCAPGTVWDPDAYTCNHAP